MRERFVSRKKKKRMGERTETKNQCGCTFLKLEMWVFRVGYLNCCEENWCFSEHKSNKELVDAGRGETVRKKDRWQVEIKI